LILMGIGTNVYAKSVQHVTALNMIDIEFYGEKRIKDAWNLYRSHLNSPDPQDKPGHDRWEERRVDYLVDLLYEMSKYFKYEDFDRVLIRNGAYIPISHGIWDVQNFLIMDGFVKLFAGKVPIRIKIDNQNEDELTQADSQLK
jgi:hypothetical protein